MLLQDIPITFEYGNHYEHLELTEQQVGFKTNHNWSAFVRLNDDKGDITDYIESVDFYLHETFGNDGPINIKAVDRTQRLTKMPGQKRGEICVTYNSRGVFDMKVTINFKDELEVEPIDIEYPLIFEGKGTISKKTVRFNTNFLRELQYKKSKQDYIPIVAEGEEGAQKLPDAKIRYNGVVRDLKKNFNYSSW